MINIFQFRKLGKGKLNNLPKIIKISIKNQTLSLGPQSHPAFFTLHILPQPAPHPQPPPMGDSQARHGFMYSGVKCLFKAKVWNPKS